jgi:hypothetical protein
MRLLDLGCLAAADLYIVRVLLLAELLLLVAQNRESLTKGILLDLVCLEKDLKRGIESWTFWLGGQELGHCGLMLFKKP